MMSEIRTTAVLFAMLALPGWALLSASGLWRRYAPLQRWCVALGLGIVFYPVLYYLARLIPGMRLGLNKLVFILFVSLVVLVWTQRKVWKEQFAFDRLENVGLSLFGAVLLTRLWPAHLQPFPAWSDSLHHTLLTQLVAAGGRLPQTMEPFEPVSLDMYHLGLYAISGTLQSLAAIPAYTALIYAAQVLNAMCVIGVYLALDYMVNRKAAVTGVLVVGLLSFQPAWYFNWGRFTQLASQTVMPIAWVLTLEAFVMFREQSLGWRPRGMAAAAAGLLTAGVFLLHFRVAGLYLPLLLITVIYELVCAVREKRTFWPIFVASILIAAVSLLLVAPVLLDALRVYIRSHQQAAAASAEESSRAYFETPLRTLIEIGLHPWLLGLTAISALLGLVWRNRVTGFMLGWIVLLVGEGYLYLTGISSLAFINYSAIIILYYLPASLLIGAAVGEALDRIPFLQTPRVQQALAWLLIVLAFAGGLARVSALEDYRFFFTPQDQAGMAWIIQNTAPDAVFAIDTYMWLGNSPHGADGGYWIPYFTGRKTTTGSMMFGLGPADYVHKIRELSGFVTRIETDPAAMQSLCDAGVDYVYMGAKRDRLQGSFDPSRLVIRYAERVLFAQSGVVILRTCP